MQEIKISPEDIRLFILSNAGHYPDKQHFYFFKRHFLEKYGTFDNYDLQIIHKECHTCGGTGIWKRYGWDYGKFVVVDRDTCWHCTKGIYETVHVFLERWKLDGKLFHLPSLRTPKVFGQMNLFSGKPDLLINTITGLITHEKVDSAAASNAYSLLDKKYHHTLYSPRHCEERSDEAISQKQAP